MATDVIFLILAVLQGNSAVKTDLSTSGCSLHCRLTHNIEIMEELNIVWEQILDTVQGTQSPLLGAFLVFCCVFIV